MKRFDVFNGDADGIISLVQLRLAEPCDSELVTGRKRDIQLLDRVMAEKDDLVTVLDISMRSNAKDLKRILDAGAFVDYIDHHNAGEFPRHPNLNRLIDTSPEICTAILVDDRLKGSFRAWAVTAAFGDNFPKVAKRKAAGLDLPLTQLEHLGMLVNYNGYGASLDDLHFHPADLFRELVRYNTPMEFLDSGSVVYAALEAGFEADRAMMSKGKAAIDTDTHFALILPDLAASRRMSGVYGNALAQQHPNRAHAVLTAQKGGYLVSIRAPISNRAGADILAMQFETGGGRSAAAGINHLPNEELDKFLRKFQTSFLNADA